MKDIKDNEELNAAADFLGKSQNSPDALLNLIEKGELPDDMDIRTKRKLEKLAKGEQK
jgi:hypothetical protein